MFIYYKSDNYINNLCTYILQRKVSEGNFSSCMCVRWKRSNDVLN